MDEKYPEGIAFFNEPGAIDLILLIYHKKEITTTTIRELTGNYDRLKGLVWVMRDIGLADIKRIEKPRLKYLIRLTEKGEKVAELLEQIDHVMLS